jgi:hypothetical protein
LSVAQFEQLVLHAEAARTTPTPDLALRSGVSVCTLVRYAAGCGDDADVTKWVTRYRWCAKVVVDLVRGARAPGSRASRLLALARQNALPPEPELLSELAAL